MQMLLNMYQELIVFLTGAIPKAILFVLFGFIVARTISRGITKLSQGRLSLHQSLLLRRIIFYSIVLLFLISAFQELGFHLSVLLGATGVLTVAIGIASQTSMSNVVSGIFLIGEKSFVIGDTIRVNDLQGQVISIDFLSVKIRTDENTMVRIPNEVLIKSALINRSYFPTVRINFTLNMLYEEDVEKVQKVFAEVAAKNPWCLNDPKPSLVIQEFTENAILLQCFAWAKQENNAQLKNTLQEELKQAFIENGITMPVYPQVVGSLIKNLPLKVEANTKSK